MANYTTIRRGLNADYKGASNEREHDLKRMITKYKLTGQVEFSKKDNWVKVGGEVFNAVSKEMFYKIVGEENVSNKSD